MLPPARSLGTARSERSKIKVLLLHMGLASILYQLRVQICFLRASCIYFHTYYPCEEPDGNIQGHPSLCTAPVKGDSHTKGLQKTKNGMKQWQSSLRQHSTAGGNRTAPEDSWKLVNAVREIEGSGASEFNLPI